MNIHHMSRQSGILSRHGSLFTIICVLAAGTMVGAAGGEGYPPGSTPERLMRQAHEAALSGDLARHFAMLREAIRIDPNFRLARWQLGQIEVDGQWIAVEEAQRRAAADPRQAEYRRQRELHGDTAEDQLALARWCRRNGLDEESRFHWQTVLAFQPANEEALRALGVRWHEGQLLTPAQIDAARKHDRATRQAVRRWRSTLSRWYTAIGSADDAVREAALQDVRSLSEADVIPALEAITFGRDAVRSGHAEQHRHFSLAALDALDGMPADAATESLVRHAVLAPADEVLAAAIEHLKNRPLNEFVPLLLEGLAMPIESSFSVITDASGSVHYRHSLYREGPVSDMSIQTRLAVVQNDLGGRRFTRIRGTDATVIGPPTGAEPASVLRKGAIAAGSQGRFGHAATATERQVAQLNRQTEALNARIIHVLRETTGQDLVESPVAWWDWWRERNEYYAAEERPVAERYLSDTKSYYHGEPIYDSRYPDSRPSGTTSTSWPVSATPASRQFVPPPYRHTNCRTCFASGTLVWTKTGQRTIESLELGDLVLSQDVHTGELAYKPITGRTVRPPSPIVKLSLDGDELRSTLGHPLWVAGMGWRMAKELDDGAMLHAVTGTVPVAGIEKLPEAEAFNLVVADFNTYFVGESGILVHDNTARKPTRAALPGLAAAK